VEAANELKIPRAAAMPALPHPGREPGFKSGLEPSQGPYGWVNLPTASKKSRAAGPLPANWHVTTRYDWRARVRPKLAKGFLEMQDQLRLCVMSSLRYHTRL